MAMDKVLESSAFKWNLSKARLHLQRAGRALLDSNKTKNFSKKTAVDHRDDSK